MGWGPNIYVLHFSKVLAWYDRLHLNSRYTISRHMVDHKNFMSLTTHLTTYTVHVNMVKPSRSQSQQRFSTEHDRQDRTLTFETQFCDAQGWMPRHHGHLPGILKEIFWKFGDNALVRRSYITYQVQITFVVYELIKQIPDQGTCCLLHKISVMHNTIYMSLRG